MRLLTDAESWGETKGAVRVSSSSRSIVLLEKNRVLGQRLARVLSAGADLAELHVEDTPGELKKKITESTLLVAVDSSDLDVALGWVRGPWPHLKILTWSQGSLEAPLQVARHEPALQSLIGWPAHQSLPRPWEVSLASRRALDGPAAKGPRLSDLLAWGATTIRWVPRNSAERDHAVAEVERYAALAGAGSRLIERLAIVAHEMLMNAMYDAPVDAAGRALYAHDRKADVILDDREAPTLRLGLDGMTAALEVTDPFGRLQRKHVLGSVLRGLEGARNEQAQVLDTTHGGAGLGFFRMYGACTSVVVDVKPRESTRVAALFDLDASVREARAAPASLHLFLD